MIRLTNTRSGVVVRVDARMAALLGAEWKPDEAPKPKRKTAPKKGASDGAGNAGRRRGGAGSKPDDGGGLEV